MSRRGPFRLLFVPHLGVSPALNAYSSRALLTRVALLCRCPCTVWHPSRRSRQTSATPTTPRLQVGPTAQPGFSQPVGQVMDVRVASVVQLRWLESLHGSNGLWAPPLGLAASSSASPTRSGNRRRGQLVLPPSVFDRCSCVVSSALPCRAQNFVRQESSPVSTQSERSLAAHLHLHSPLLHCSAFFALKWGYYGSREWWKFHGSNWREGE